MLPGELFVFVNCNFEHCMIIIQATIHVSPVRILKAPYVNLYQDYHHFNKRPMGHIAHMRKQFKSINTRWLREEKKTLLTLGEFIAGSSFEQTWIPFTQDALCQVWLKLAQWFWRRRFFNFFNVFSLFRNYLPLEKGGGLHLNKLESHSPKDALCQVWLKLAQWFWRRRFLNFVNVFELSAKVR